LSNLHHAFPERSETWHRATARESFRVYGVLKTLHGVRVIEVHTGFYVSPDLQWQAVRLEDGRRWDVSSCDRRVNSATIITTRREAIETLAVMGD
jgi:hypothetical protein